MGIKKPIIEETIALPGETAYRRVLGFDVKLPTKEQLELKKLYVRPKKVKKLPYTASRDRWIIDLMDSNHKVKDRVIFTKFVKTKLRRQVAAFLSVAEEGDIVEYYKFVKRMRVPNLLTVEIVRGIPRAWVKSGNTIKKVVYFIEES